nr:hypothetical protein [Pseudopedobacter sp.]
MSQELNNELLLSQQSSLPQKYSAWMEEFQEIPQQINHSLFKPMNKMSKTISRLVKNRGRMLMLLDCRVSRLIKNSRK